MIILISSSYTTNSFHLVHPVGSMVLLVSNAVCQCLDCICYTIARLHPPNFANFSVDQVKHFHLQIRIGRLPLSPSPFVRGFNSWRIYFLILSARSFFILFSFVINYFTWIASIWIKRWYCNESMAISQSNVDMFRSAWMDVQLKATRLSCGVWSNTR